jgi:hypothetical protein
MGEIIERKCKQCKETIVIDADNIQGVALYNKSYYHTDCLRSNAEQKVADKKGKWQAWASALAQIEKYEQEAYKSIRASVVRNELNEYILDNYDVVAVPSRFWQIIADLENGKYRQKVCRPVSTEDVLGAWKWGQQRLDKLNVKNKMNNSGPAGDEERVMYDLAIIVSKMGKYWAYKGKQEAAAQTAIPETAQPKIDYTAISNTTKQNSEESHDIEDLMDEIF